MYNSCKDTLVCTGDATSAVCKSKNDGVGTGEEADGRKNLGYNQTCTNDESCISGLVCKQTDNNVCRCENEASSFWNADKKACEERSNLEQNCTFNMYNSCKDTLVCTGDATSAVCKSKNDGVGTGEEADGRKNLGYNQTCTNDESCISGLVCKQTDNNVCRCENEASSFWNADKKACEERSGLGQKCTFNSCIDTLVCTEDATGAVCKIKKDDVGTGEEEDDQANLPIYVGVPIGCLVAISVIVITVWYCKREKRKNSIYGRTVSYSNGQSSNLNIDVGYSEVVLEGNVNGDQAYDLVQPMNLGNDGNYSIAMSDVKGPRSESPTQTTATNNYGYGVLGGKRAENDDNDMYSHARRMNDTGEYDAFDKRDRDTDVNDLYDHTRGITMENQYDEFQKRK
ncbi:uncharacterized protein LOC110446745 [Mizuhopecten yessoensis]|nr:uncharacterized protein LOC110446745 [Mizuhopecten yessoensis]